MLEFRGPMTNCNNAHHIKVPCKESHRSCPVDLCTADVSSSLGFKRMGEDGRAGTGKERSCSECDMRYVIVTFLSTTVKVLSFKILKICTVTFDVY